MSTVEHAGYTLDLDRNVIITPSGQEIEVTDRAIKYDPYPSKNHYTAGYRVATCIYWQVDSLPEGVEVHHMDMDRTNNTMSNLTMLTKNDHRKAHAMMHRMTTLLVRDIEAALKERERYLNFLEDRAVRL